MGGAPLGGLIAGTLTAQGGTRLAFAVAGTMAILVAVTGAAVLYAGRPTRSRDASNPRGGGMTEQTFPTTHCTFGVARRDVTPPVGIYARSWGAATHEVAEGVHRPLTATAAVFAPLDGDGPELALVALDIGWLQYAPDERGLRASIRSGRASARSSCSSRCRTPTPARTRTRSSTDKPGVELIQPYLDGLATHIARRDPRGAGAGRGGTRHLRLRPLRPRREPRLLGRGRGPVRLRLQPRRAGRRHPARRRASTGGDGAVLATLFNYACHPTTLAWDNRLLSPDYIGAAREVLEPAFGAPALFFHGASGELAPRDDYVGDTGRRRPQRPPARIRRRRRDRGAAAGGDPVRLHGHRRLRRQPRHLGVPSRASRPSSPRAAASPHG